MSAVNFFFLFVLTFCFRFKYSHSCVSSCHFLCQCLPKFSGVCQISCHFPSFLWLFYPSAIWLFVCILFCPEILLTTELGTILPNASLPKYHVRRRIFHLNNSPIGTYLPRLQFCIQNAAENIKIHHHMYFSEYNITQDG